MFVFIFVQLANVFLVHSAKILAEDTDKIEVEYESINPKDDVEYVFKRVKEKVMLFAFGFLPEKKLDYYKQVLHSRLAEIKYISDNKDIANIERGTKRYSATAGQIAEYVLENTSLENRKSEFVALFTQHSNLVKQYQKNYNDTTAEWRFFEDDYNSLKSYISKLSE